VVFWRGLSVLLAALLIVLLVVLLLRSAFGALP